MKFSTRYEDDSESSDSEFSDGFDGRLDDDFNRIIKQMKMKKAAEEQKSRFDGEENNNGVAVEPTINGNDEPTGTDTDLSADRSDENVEDCSIVDETFVLEITEENDEDVQDESEHFSDVSK